MIHTVLATIIGELNTYLKQLQPSADGELALLSKLVDQAGNLSVENDEQLLCHLINVEQERSNLNAKLTSSYRSNRPINLNLYVLFASHANTHFAALRQLSSTIAFFQGKQLFTPGDTPKLPDEVEKLTAEIHSLDLHQISNLWGALGTKALPSVVIKLRMISITRDMMKEEITEISKVEVQ